MLNITSNQNIIGKITVEEEGVQADVIELNAFISKENSICNINSNISNKELYNKNKKAIQSEINEFYDYVYSLVD